MKKTVIRGASIGLVFTGISYLVVKYIGFRWKSLTVLMYMYVALGVLMAVASEMDAINSGLKTTLDRIVVVAEEEELKLKKVVSGEKYKIKGDLEKI